MDRVGQWVVCRRVVSVIELSCGAYARCVEPAAWRYADESEAKAKAKAETWSIGEMLCYTIVGTREVRVFCQAVKGVHNRGRPTSQHRIGSLGYSTRVIVRAEHFKCAPTLLLLRQTPLFCDSSKRNDTNKDAVYPMVRIWGTSTLYVGIWPCKATRNDYLHGPCQESLDKIFQNPLWGL